MNVVFCNLKRIVKNGKVIACEIKGDDIQLANDMLRGAYEDKFDTAILVSGDEDFIPVVKTLQHLKKKVENLYFRKRSSMRLRKLCNSATNIRFILNKKLWQSSKTPPSGNYN